jgi:hypothetical protein
MLYLENFYELENFSQIWMYALKISQKLLKDSQADEGWVGPLVKLAP